MNTTGIAIRCSNIKKTFSDGPYLVEVLKDVSLRVRNSETVAIVGPSGSGKTTLLNIIASFEKPTKGQVYIDGKSTSDLAEKEISEIRRWKIGMIFQDFYLMPTLSVLENVEIPMLVAGLSEDECRDEATELLASVGLSNRMSYQPNQLSSGEKQRVGIVRAIANNPSVILADEPTGNLDTKTGEDIFLLLRRFADEQQKAVLIATHDIHIASHSDRTLLLKDGFLTNLNGK